MHVDADSLRPMLRRPCGISVLRSLSEEATQSTISIDLTTLDVDVIRGIVTDVRKMVRRRRRRRPSTMRS